MAPKKKEQQKMSLGDFLQDQSYGGSLANLYTAGTQALPPAERAGYRPSGGGWGSSGGDRPERRDYGGYSSIRENLPQQLPDKPPYTAHLGNLSYDATDETVTEFFEGCDLTSVRIIEDREQQRPKGFAYAEFAHLEGLKQALTLDGTTFQGRAIRIKVADPPRGGDRGESTRDFSDWSRKGPLPDAPARGGFDRRGSEFGERRAREPREPREDDGKVRDFGNWERRGPLPPAPQEESGSRDGSRPRTNDGPREFRNRRESPAAWGEGQGPRQDSRPPRPERAPTAAEQDNQWRTKMRPDAPAKSASQSRDGSEAPPSPATSTAAPVGRPRLNLAKRTVSEAPDVLSPSGTDSKASPFGAARPIDTAAKERAIEEKKQQQIKEKREADEKAKEERRLAKEAAAKEAAEKADKEAELEAAKANGDEKAPEEEVKETTEAAEADASKEDGEQNASTRSREPKEPKETPKSRANDSNNWRSSGDRAPRGGQGGPRGRGGAGGPRGGRFEGSRPPRSNGGPAAAQQSSAPAAAESEPAATVDEDGWQTVTVPKGRRNVGRGA
ncbi:putative RNA-binding protein sce3 [Colletotrichum orbiculare MAFF 240422]|uniref:RNA-binding protein sce3 n=1 Tax=Colletotrichum orbiculare (strain 104-T / ATCC 96160 / CBS 514.97 / LARS 414 / MAFF 240422) TaxID=1213857 RepID=A0A484FLR9_COLOR|nr:putative RNA-binding protein sce3 [Colletotrichum orbiculare MAFF 240422]